MKHEIEVMLPDGHGVIVNNASAGGLIGYPNAAYATMKHGVVGLTRSASRQYEGEGLRFNAVCPGWIDTGDDRSVERRPRAKRLRPLATERETVWRGA